MAAHKHAALMLQYAQDAAETDSPWERWEVKINNGEWCELNGNPNWVEDWGYRRKPQVISVGRHEFPKPISKAPLNGISYYFVRTGNSCFEVDICAWVSSRLDNMRLESGRIHLTHEAAQAQADVLNAVCRGDIE